MNSEYLKEAVLEARRFILRANELKERADNKKEIYINPYFGSKESGAVKRASLDLSRALSKLRNER